MYFFLCKKKRAFGVKARLSGIKNSWKYEKDLIILNEKQRAQTIRQPGKIQEYQYCPVRQYIFSKKF